MMKAIGCSVRVEGGGRSGGRGGDGKRAAFAGDGHAEVARGRVISGGRSGGCGDEDDDGCGNSGNDMSCLGGVCWNKHAMHGCVAGVCVCVVCWRHAVELLCQSESRSWGRTDAWLLRPGCSILGGG
ncbi:hypothetical protein PVAP13_5NG514786 [Panicum virgatum]|uniref:Uncharacterized protein n=1 Tax=Panicum virgatum TaxID=38727 RepID=A0A8T0RZS7_PANVG|nr:hypothetical protein PVAP13_5NG514786 [Panicum virgatum]KAG2591932.1 hypothetical protein PVAP13_5NG514786 [Panicum virgatum]